MEKKYIQLGKIHIAKHKKFHKSEENVYCLLVQDSTKQYTEVGRTETLTNTLDPQWLKKFDLEYR